MRSGVERGSMAYSAVTHPCFESLRKGGTLSSAETVQITRVFPTSMRVEPSANRIKFLTMLTGLNISGSRPSLRTAPSCKSATGDQSETLRLKAGAGIRTLGARCPLHPPLAGQFQSSVQGVPASSRVPPDSLLLVPPLKS